MFKYFSIVFLVLSACNSKKTEPEAAIVLPLETEKIVALGRVEPEVKITQVGSEVSGVIDKIFVASGDSVAKGDVLLEINHDYEDAKLIQSKSKLATQQAEIRNVQAQLSALKVKSDNLQVRFERLKKIADSGAETQQSVDNAKADFDQSLRDLDRYAQQVLVAENRIAEISAEINVAQADIERRKIKAPANGVVLAMDLSEGASVNPSSKVLDFAPHSASTVLCEVDELFVNKLKLGQKAIIRTQGMDNTLAEGDVIYLSPYLKKKSLFSDDSGNMEDRRVREVRVRLEGNPMLLINSRVEAVIALK
ncbi:MAG: efflux RND transporter periplasmic adaptor subunit [Bacteroidetes bacterium]|nr:efflux RND transporter periplasmic adaptor subunit [Bacteroidota bacterium]